MPSDGGAELSVNLALHMQNEVESDDGFIAS
jgi:hypothetical protein